MAGAFAAGRVVGIGKVARLEASASYSRATYLDMFGGSAGPGLALFSDALDLSFYYRTSTLRYRSVPSVLVQHGAGGAAMFFPSAAVSFTFQGEAIVGADTPALMVFGSVAWRPRF
jgi:hypothetical protein